MIKNKINKLVLSFHLNLNRERKRIEKNELFTFLNNCIDNFSAKNYFLDLSDEDFDRFCKLKIYSLLLNEDVFKQIYANKKIVKCVLPEEFVIYINSKISKSSKFDFKFKRCQKKILFNNLYDVLRLMKLVLNFVFGKNIFISSIQSFYGFPKSSLDINSTNNLFHFFKKNISVSKDVSVTSNYVEEFSDKTFKGFLNLINLLFELMLFIFSRKKTYVTLSDYFLYRKLFLYSKFCVNYDFYFNNSSIINLPLWSFLKLKSFKYNFIFYSVNIVNLDNYDNDFKTMNGLQCQNWDDVYAWNGFLLNFLNEENFNYKNLYLYDYIPFDRSDFFNVSKLNIDSEKKVVAVFDVQPHRKTRFNCLPLSGDFYDGKESMRFLKDIYNFCLENNLIMLHKRKRDIGNFMCRKYKYLINSFDKSIYINLDTTFSPESISNHVDFVISMPLTSTYYSSSKNSFYYLPDEQKAKKYSKHFNVKCISDLTEIYND